MTMNGTNGHAGAAEAPSPPMVADMRKLLEALVRENWLKWGDGRSAGCKCYTCQAADLLELAPGPVGNT